MDSHKRERDNEKLWSGDEQSKKNSLAQMGRAHGKSECRRRMIPGPQKKEPTMVKRRKKSRNGEGETPKENLMLEMGITNHRIQRIQRRSVKQPERNTVWLHVAQDGTTWKANEREFTKTAVK